MNKDGEPLTWLVSKLSRLGDLNAEDLSRLAALPCRQQRVARSTTIVNEGDRPEQCCVLVEGFACRYKDTAEGAQQIVSFHIRGDVLDLQHLLLPRADHSVRAITEATLAWIPKEDLLRLAWERPNVGAALWRDCLVDASIFREWVLNVGRRDARSRIAHMLCEFVARCEKAGLGTADGFVLPMTQEQIGDATGLTSVHVNRTLRALTEEGAIEHKGRNFRVLEWEKLREIGDFDPAYLHATAA
jgi:CRP-like cAMP-binding protein